MAVATPNTVRAHAKGMGRRRISLALFAGVAVLPILTMGITVPSAVAKSRAESERAAMEERLSERESLSMSLKDYESDDAIGELEELHQHLVKMIPQSIGPLDEFGALRAAAARLNMHLVSTRSIRTHTVGASLVDEVLVTARDSVDQIFALTQELRRSGLPTLMLSFDLSRENPASRVFVAEVRLGFVRRAAAAQGGEPRPR